MSDNSPRTDRREMFRSSLRYLALGGIGWAAAVGIRHAVTSPPTAGCSSTLPCGQCGGMSACSLPPALAAKKDAAHAHDISPLPLAGEGSGVDCPTAAKKDTPR